MAIFLGSSQTLHIHMCFCVGRLHSMISFHLRVSKYTSVIILAFTNRYLNEKKAKWIDLKRKYFDKRKNETKNLLQNRLTRHSIGLYNRSILGYQFGFCNLLIKSSFDPEATCHSTKKNWDRMHIFSSIYKLDLPKCTVLHALSICYKYPTLRCFYRISTNWNCWKLFPINLCSLFQMYIHRRIFFPKVMKINMHASIWFVYETFIHSIETKMESNKSFRFGLPVASNTVSYLFCVLHRKTFYHYFQWCSAWLLLQLQFQTWLYLIT